MAAKEVFAVPQHTGVEQSVVYSGAKLGITEVWPGSMRQQVLYDLETAVLAGICVACYLWFSKEWKVRTHQWGATLGIRKVNGYQTRGKFQEGLHDCRFFEKGGGSKRTGGLDPTNGSVGRVEGEERNVSVGGDSVEDVQARNRYHGRGGRVYGVAAKS